MQEIHEVRRLIQERYDALDEQKVVAIAPARLAEDVYGEISKPCICEIPLLVRITSELYIRQLAREVCREKNLTEQSEAEE
jgi:hypothetical protein